MPRKGGKAIASGSYGCVFRPALECKGQDKIYNGVSKLMYTENANEEMDEMEPIFKVVKQLPNSHKYFAVSDTHMCQPKPLDEGDKYEFDKKCDNFVKDGISASNVNNNLDDLSIINMPDLGRDLHEYVEEQNPFSEESFKKFNKMMINLLVNGVVPMNKSNVLHHDLKDTNIMVDKNDNTIIIDWGFAGISNPREPVPLNIIGRPIQYNTPFSSMLINKTFVKEYKKVCERMAKKPLSNKQNKSFIQQYYAYHIKRNVGHEAYLTRAIPIAFPEEKFIKLLTNYDAQVLDAFTNGCDFDMVKYFKEVYIFNVDVWGACTVFLQFLKYKDMLQRLPESIQARAFSIYKEILLDICFKNGNERINVDKIVELLSELSGENYIMKSTKSTKSKKSLSFPDIPQTSPRGKDSLTAVRVDEPQGDKEPSVSEPASRKSSKTKTRRKRCPRGYRRHPKTKRCTIMSGPDKGKEIDTA